MNSMFWMTFVVRIDLVQYTGLDSLVCCELISFCFFVDGSTNWFGTVHVRIVQKFQPAPCYPKIFKIYLCLVVLRQLPPSHPAPCYSKITTRAKTPTSCEIPTREMWRKYALEAIIKDYYISLFMIIVYCSCYNCIVRKT